MLKQLGMDLVDLVETRTYKISKDDKPGYELVVQGFLALVRDHQGQQH